MPYSSHTVAQKISRIQAAIARIEAQDNNDRRNTDLLPSDKAAEEVWAAALELASQSKELLILATNQKTQSSNHAGPEYTLWSDIPEWQRKHLLSLLVEPITHRAVSIPPEDIPTIQYQRFLSQLMEREKRLAESVVRQESRIQQITAVDTDTGATETIQLGSPEAIKILATELSEVRHLLYGTEGKEEPPNLGRLSLDVRDLVAQVKWVTEAMRKTNTFMVSENGALMDLRTCPKLITALEARVAKLEQRTSLFTPPDTHVKAGLYVAATDTVSVPDTEIVFPKGYHVEVLTDADMTTRVFVLVQPEAPGKKVVHMITQEPNDTERDCYRGLWIVAQTHSQSDPAPVTPTEAPELPPGYRLLLQSPGRWLVLKDGKEDENGLYSTREAAVTAAWYYHTNAVWRA